MVILAINVGEEEERVRSFIEDEGYESTVLLDPQGKLSRKYYVSGIPTTYFVGPQGINYGAYQGPLDKTNLEAILAMMAESPAEDKPEVD